MPRKAWLSAEPRALARFGVNELIFDFRSESIADSIDRLQRFVAEVMPLGGD
jgi:hypothetical protein